ncbi:beta-N-acetylhexosaminidase [Niveibacterium sp. 24ML]|uniref:beta-N-acetylhexosaminidase n=1 Tax=Niveibacterium sp. 24ML TaxID=2985512 RepID=UPI00226E386C|nr:beta-N-acetylhexosaminidase [Niveibacterium sp. 24ML]MCX9158290.1 beta-N-acetylhexosaminidase [Niveibacterium sp. 24ML]
MCDVAAFSLTDDERVRLSHPLVGGVILFKRNFESPEQLAALTQEIHALRSPNLIIAVDHEGGRVQRFLGGFTRLPPMRALGEQWVRDHVAGLELARQTGYVLAAELLAHGVDLSFTPVLDLDYGRSAVIGDRAFSGDPGIVAALAQALVAGLGEAGMGAVGKHFPGHGWAEADSHVGIPRDERSFEQIWASDIAPYRHRLGRQLAGVMPAHVIYEHVDAQPAGFSPYWLQAVLRERLGFDGVVFSDDLTMEGASVAGDILARAAAAHAAGCDMVLVCNRPDLADDLLARWAPEILPRSTARIEALRPRQAKDPFELAVEPRYVAAQRAVSELVASLG